jgi:hypothetical protein
MTNFKHPVTALDKAVARRAVHPLRSATVGSLRNVVSTTAWNPFKLVQALTASSNWFG